MVELKPKDEVLNAGALNDDDDEEDEVVELKQEVLDEYLLTACKENNYEEAVLRLQ